MHNDQQVWFITGASQGFGLELVRQLLARGHRVAATSRDVAALRRAVYDEAGDGMGGGHAADFLPLEVDLTTEASVAEAVAAAVARFGRLDVVANNAGYGQLGSLEELSDAEARANFEVNVFGTLHVIRHAMPHLRARGAGHVINFSSVAGLTGGFPGWGVYCATKFAVEGLSESLAAEAAPFGVRVTVVEPGYFRTNFLAPSSLRVPGAPIGAYAAVRESEATHQQQIRGNQPGDPAKAAAAVIRVAAESDPPLHLLLGDDAYDLTRSKLDALAGDMTRWEALTRSTGFAAPGAAAP